MSLFLECVPNEIWIYILDYLDGNSLVLLESVSTFFAPIVPIVSKGKSIHIYRLLLPSVISKIGKKYQFSCYSIHLDKKIKDYQLVRLTEPLIELRHTRRIRYQLIDLSNCNNITESILISYYRSSATILELFEEVNLAGCQNLKSGEEENYYFGNVLRKCRRINISYCYNLPSNFLKYLESSEEIIADGCGNFDLSFLTNLRKCRSFSIRRCRDLQNDHLEYFIKLEKIDISGCTEISQIPFDLTCTEFRANGCHKLNDIWLKNLEKCQIVHLSNCQNITSFGIRFLRSVVEINLSGCIKVSSECTMYLRNCKKIDLSKCPLITNDALSYLDNCTELNIADCPEITNEGIQYLRCSKLIISEADTKKLSKEVLKKLPSRVFYQK